MLVLVKSDHDQVRKLNIEDGNLRAVLAVMYLLLRELRRLNETGSIAARQLITRVSKGYA